VADPEPEPDPDPDEADEPDTDDIARAPFPVPAFVRESALPAASERCTTADCIVIPSDGTEPEAMAPAARLDVAEPSGEPVDPAALDALIRCAVDRSTLPLTRRNAPPLECAGRVDADDERDAGDEEEAAEEEEEDHEDDGEVPVALSARRAPLAALDPAKVRLIAVAFVAELTTGPATATPDVRAAETAAAPLEPAEPPKLAIPPEPYESDDPNDIDEPDEPAEPAEPDEPDEPVDATAAVAARDRRI
jgi:hypothetical protein